MKLQGPQLKALSSSLFSYFRSQDDPPADEIYVPVENIRQDEGGEDVYHATIRFIVNYCGRKVHNVRIKFKIDSVGRFIPKTFQYI
jgi:hypothetical protein